MASTTTDVRAWLREKGHKVGDRGMIPADLQEEYDLAHAPAGVVPGEVIEQDYPGAEDVTAADEPAPPSGPAPGERKPRDVRGRRPAFPKIFGRRAGKGSGTGGKRRRGGRPRMPRMSLGDFAEDTWLDLAWLASPLPPLAAVLQMQAPYAGVVLDEQVRGTFVDTLLQPAARYQGLFRALNGLMGPPVCVLLICLEGRRDPATGRYDGRTQMMFGMLKYSLLQMTKVSELNAEDIAERTESLAARTAVVDHIVARLFALEPPPPETFDPDSGQPGPDAGGGAVFDAQPPGAAFRYPAPPDMDGTGADPGRMTG